MRQVRASRRNRLALACALMVATACEAGDDLRVFAPIDVAADQLPAVDPGRVWRYRAATVDADSLIAVLRRSALPVAEIWVPLIDLCEDPIGPRITVVLSRADDGPARYDFEPGNGIRACTRRVRRYRWLH